MALTPMDTSFDRAAIIRRAGYALCWVVPVAIVNQVAHAKDAGGLVFITFLLIIVGFAFGGYATAREADSQPLQHAALAAILAFVVVQAVGIVIALARGSSVNLPGIIITALLAASAGVLGGILAVRSTRAPGPD